MLELGLPVHPLPRRVQEVTGQFDESELVTNVVYPLPMFSVVVEEEYIIECDEGAPEAYDSVLHVF